jgi:uncharacterized protein DUF6335
MAKSRTRRASARKAVSRTTRKKKAAPRPKAKVGKATKARAAKARPAGRARTARKPPARTSAVRRTAKGLQARTPKPTKTRPKKTGLKKAAARNPRQAKAARPTPKAKAIVAKPAPPPKPVAKTAQTPRTKGAARLKPAFPPPGLHRERKRLPEAEAVPTPPSSLDLGVHPSAARSGQAEIQQHLAAHTETGPALTGGDLDANWETAYSSGDEAPGGDNPTPDQDIVDQIGRSLGLEYEDDEELKGAEKLEERDKHRWELDPASSEDYDDRD